MRFILMVNAYCLVNRVIINFKEIVLNVIKIVNNVSIIKAVLNVINRNQI